MSISQKISSRAAGQRGIAMVELVIITPAILFLMFGVTELGSAILHYNTLTKAVQDGARHAAAYGLLGTTGSVVIDADLNTEIRNLVVYGDAQGAATPLLNGMTTDQVDITIPEPGHIRVDATYPYVPGFGTSLPNFGFGSSTSLAVDLRAGVTMRAL